MSVKSDINKAGWEQSEFPILCETCKSHMYGPMTVPQELSAKAWGTMHTFAWYRLINCSVLLQLTWHSLNKSLVEVVGPATGLSLYSVGILAQACGTRLP